MWSTAECTQRSAKWIDLLRLLCYAEKKLLHRAALQDGCPGSLPQRSSDRCGGNPVSAFLGPSEKAFVPAQFSLLISLRKKSFIFSIFSQNSNDFLREMGYTINCRARGAATAYLHMIPPHTKAIPQTEIPSGVPQALGGVFVFIRFCIL